MDNIENAKNSIENDGKRGPWALSISFLWDEVGYIEEGQHKLYIFVI